MTAYGVGVVLDMGSSLGRMANNCISMAVSDFYSIHRHYKTRLILHTRDSMGDPLYALSSTIDLLENKDVHAILGPQTSEEAEFLVHLGDKAGVPIVTFSVTTPFLSQEKTPYLVRVAINDKAQVKAIAAIVQAFRWRQVTLIHEDSNYGNGVIPYLIGAFEEIDSRVPHRSVISLRATDDQITIELQKLMTMSTKVFVVHMSSSLASRFFLKAKELGMMSKGYAWIITDGITSILNSMDPSVIDSMQGLIGLRPYIPPSEELNNFTVKLRNKFPKDNRRPILNELNIFCLWAYDAVWALARASEEISPRKSQPEKLKSLSKFTNLASISVSQTGSKILKAVLQSKFNGLSGKFQLKDGQLEPVAFQLVNVVGNGVKGIGFWTPKHGISRELNLSDSQLYSTSANSLQPTIWPGLSAVTPKVKVDRDLQTGVVSVSGFCIDVFKAAVENLPYALTYEFIPFDNSNGSSALTYTDLVFQVYLQVFDAVVGDVTITSNRSLYVDFTLPYTELGVGMVVPIEIGKAKNMWIFLEPLTVDLWLVSGAFFILTGCIVWFIERKINDEFKGSRAQQVGMIFWYSFSTLVFSQREKLISNLSKFVVIVWLFAVLILTSSYTASLSSMLTVNRLQMLQNGSFIGYQKGSLAREEVNILNFANSSLQTYGSIEAYAHALTEGSKKGGVSAIIDEIPYIKLFLAQYGDQYTMIEPKYLTTNGFGFVFPKGSPLVPDISWAIAKLREDGKLDMIQQTWFQDQSVFKKQESPTKPSILDSYSFRGLFLVTGTSSTLALIIFYVFLIRNKLTSEGQPQLSNWIAQEPLSDDSISMSAAALDISDHPTDNNISTEGEENLSETDNGNQPS
ncbi:Glutamate receptor 2.7 [Vitis vinifera]|uniref:Glutamate receptor n=1 Tax=Vitis vinifera TaxID=29760 RepID=A0A438GTF2_VITVI|nr:Glutamate receptor 2.7 [Vitis vinifera]